MELVDETVAEVAENVAEVSGADQISLLAISEVLEQMLSEYANDASIVLKVFNDNPPGMPVQCHKVVMVCLGGILNDLHNVATGSSATSSASGSEGAQDMPQVLVNNPTLGADLKMKTEHGGLTTAFVLALVAGHVDQHIPDVRRMLGALELAVNHNTHFAG